MSKKKKSDTCFAVAVGVALAIICAIAVIQPYMEMKTFNKFSERKATYYDALFAELRINGEQK